MKRFHFYTLLFLLNFAPVIVQAQAVSDLLETIPQNQIELKGYVGEQTDLIINNRVLTQDYDCLVEPFRHKNETKYWQMEFWGKWMLGAVAAWEYTHDAKIMDNIALQIFTIINASID